MQGTTFICSHCECRAEHDNIPVVLYLVAGLAPLHPKSSGSDSMDVTEIPMPDVVRRLFADGGRWEFCVPCFAALFNVPLVDKQGAVVATPSGAKEHLRTWAPQQSTTGVVATPAGATAE